MRDFTFRKYNELCISLLNNNFSHKRLDEYFEDQNRDEKTFIMRHDVDKKPENSLEIAKIEHELGIKSTFYFRTTNEVFKEDIICQIRDLGHEIGYHYEVLAKANGDFKLAIETFQRELSQFRNFTDIKTISRHGSPISKWDCDDLEPEWNDFEELVWPGLAKRIPAFEELKLTGGWAGYYDTNKLDNNAIVGKHPAYKNVYLATGFTGRGLMQSPGIGRGLTELITTGSYQTIDLNCFGIERVLNKKERIEPYVL